MNQDIFIDRKNRKVIKPEDRAVEDRNSVYGFIIESEKLLLVRAEGFDKWEIPGGGQEENEDDFTALKREMLEEANCEIREIGELIGQDQCNFYADDLDKYFLGKRRYYLVKKYTFIEKPLQNEIEENKMFPLSKFDFSFVRIDHRKIIRKILLQKNGGEND
jgi:8-oxo-dGTP pyrophosphatase MutT (NUDIX family)